MTVKAQNEWGGPYVPYTPPVRTLADVFAELDAMENAPQFTSWESLKAQRAFTKPEPLTETQWEITHVIDDLEELLIEKNRAYGNSFAEPIGIFAKDITARQQVYVRIDDKLNRIQKGSEYQGDDTLIDLIGYLILLLVINRKEQAR